jgi:hypothetical protein
MSHTPDSGKSKAGAFDIRTFIASLIGLYGVILLIMGIVAQSAQDDIRAGGANVNLVAGICMIVFAVLFQAWAMLRPVIVDESEIDRDDSGRPPGH